MLESNKFLEAEREIWGKGNIDFIGRLKRSMNFKTKEIVNKSLVDYHTTLSLEVPTTYRYASGTQEAEYISIAKYDRYQPVAIDNIAMTTAENWLHSHFFTSMGASTISDVSSVLTEMNMSSSPGCPENKHYATKREMFDDLGEQPVIDFVNKAMATNDYPEPFWVCSLKKEMRLWTKILENKLRTFTASNVKFSVLLNCLCLAMNVAFYKAGHNGEVWSCVGISKYSRGWNKIGQRLDKHPNKFELDASSYDASLFQRLFWIICRFRIGCLKDGAKYAKLMKRCYTTIVFSVIVLISGTVIRKRTGNPSGSSNTVVDNTLILFLLLAYAWIRVVPAPYNQSYSLFMESVEALLYGDDNTFSVSDEAVKYFNALTVCKELATLGIVLTAGDDVWTARSIYEVKFLSNNFVKHNGMFFPKPEYDKLMCSLLYGARHDDVRWHMLRAYALLMDGFWNVEFRTRIRGYLNFLIVNYHKFLKPGIVYKEITFDMVKGLHKTDMQLYSLYMSYESENFEKPGLQ